MGISTIELEAFVKKNIDVYAVTESGFIIPLTYDKDYLGGSFYSVIDDDDMEAFKNFNAMKMIESKLEFSDCHGGICTEFDIPNFTAVKELIDAFGGLKELRIKEIK